MSWKCGQFCVDFKCGGRKTRKPKKNMWVSHRLVLLNWPKKAFISNDINMRKSQTLFSKMSELVTRLDGVILILA